MKFSCTYALVDDIICQSIFISGKFLHYGLRYSYLGKSNFNRKSMLYFHIILEDKAGFLKKYISQNSCEASKEEVLMEKTLERDTYFSRTLSQTEQKMRYDEAVKEILANKIVLAHILKGCVEEYEGCSVEEITQKYIEGEPEIGKAGVHKDEINTLQMKDGRIEGISLEDNSQTEGKVYSIWICTNPPIDLKNTITKYQMQPKPLVGDYVASREKYDLMTLVMICLDLEKTKYIRKLLWCSNDRAV